MSSWRMVGLLDLELTLQGSGYEQARKDEMEDMMSDLNMEASS